MNLAFRTIVVATDFSDASALALEYARVLAKRFGAGLRVLHVVATPRPLGTEIYVPEAMSVSDVAVADAQRLMGETLAKFEGTPVVGQVLVGNPARKIVEYASDHDVDLLVIGTHGRSGLSHLLMGSVAERVVRTAPCPVFTTRGSAALEIADDERGAVAIL